jgi:hypothetical protein
MLVLIFGMVATPTGDAQGSCVVPGQPLNDNYLCSLELNRAGTQLNRTETLEDIRDTTNATVQSDLLNPPSSGGPPETTSCNGVGYGKTVWYDFYPDTSGSVRIRTSGFDNVITLYTFSRSTLSPDATHRQCVHTSSFPSEELDAQVYKGLAYTIQIGGVNGASGQLQFLFDFFATPPKRLSASATLQARALRGGIELLSLSVATARAAHVGVSCSGHCRPESAFGRAVETFPHLHGVRMPAGSKLQIRVTASHSIGVLIQYNILRGNFTKQTFCTEPGSRKARTRCH